MPKRAGLDSRPRHRRVHQQLNQDVTLLELLKQVQYFRMLPATELRTLAEKCQPVTLPRGGRVFLEGDSCRGLFIIADGRVEIRQTSHRGREQVLHSEGPGATLGEGPLFDRGGYIASAVAIEPTRVFFLPRPMLVALCLRHPAVALAIAEALARRMRGFAVTVGDLVFRSVLERLAQFIEASAAPLGQSLAADARVDLKLTQEQLAARLGTVRELVARSLAQLEKSGIIRRSRTVVTVRDPARLASLSRGGPEVPQRSSYPV